MNQKDLPLKSIKSFFVNPGLYIKESGGLKSFQAVYETPIGMVFFVPSKSSMYAILFPLSESIVLFFVLGSGSIYAYSPVKLKVDISLVEKTLSSSLVKIGKSAEVEKSNP
ncbi:MAG: hypothetical protein BWY38_03030 [Ignavibacteria bacterium ADurb.Bin266]|nr:MAG: hypothetical protein BWY38_03030 [Ignavibacteria bacterium ADurb.Bin266]